MSYFSTVTTLGTPQDAMLQEIRLESFFPADDRAAAHTWPATAPEWPDLAEVLSARRTPAPDLD